MLLKIKTVLLDSFNFFSEQWSINNFLNLFLPQFSWEGLKRLLVSNLLLVNATLPSHAEHSYSWGGGQREVLIFRIG